MMELQEMIEAARGDIPVDLLFENARIVDVFGGTISHGNLAVSGGYIVGTGDDYSAKKKIDLQGRYVAPGFIDSHVHIESSMVSPGEFARGVVPMGTTTVVADPHEIANVLGVDGLNYMLESGVGQPLNICFSLSSCVPATHMETSGAELTADDLFPFLKGNEQIVALAELMNYPGVIRCDPEVLAKIEMAKKCRKPVDGHAPGLRGKQLSAYVAAGISSDHECTTVEEAMEKLMAGMHIMVREGTCAKNLDALFPMINEQTVQRMMWCTDDRHPHDLIAGGHIDYIVKRAVKKGLDPIIAIRMATLNPAEYFGLKDVGAIAPGRRADFIVFSSLENMEVETVYALGKKVARNGKMLPEVPVPTPMACPPSMRVDMDRVDFTIPITGKRIRVIDIIPNQLLTGNVMMEPSISSGVAISDPERDLLKIAVIERHAATGNMGMGFVRGFGLKSGAMASSVAHDSHNIIVAGVNDDDMRAALEEVVRMGGGFAIAKDQRVINSLALPIAGLMSDRPLPEVNANMDALVKECHDLGSELDDPFMTMGFLALPVIPDLKITDIGLVDVTAFKLVSLFENN